MGVIDINGLNSINAANEAEQARSRARARARRQAEMDVAFEEEREEALRAAAEAEEEQWELLQEGKRQKAEGNEVGGSTRIHKSMAVKNVKIGDADSDQEEGLQKVLEKVEEAWGEAKKGLEQAHSLINHLQGQVLEERAGKKTYKKKYRALAKMLNDHGVENDKIANYIGTYLRNGEE